MSENEQRSDMVKANDAAQEVKSVAPLTVRMGEMSANKLRQQIESYKAQRTDLLSKSPSDVPIEQSLEKELYLAHELLKVANSTTRPVSIDMLHANAERMPADLQAQLEERRRFFKQAMTRIRIPLSVTTQDILDECERVREAHANARIVELEGKGGSLTSQERIELKLLKLRNVQRELREQVLRFAKRARTLDASLDHGHRKKRRLTLKDMRSLERLERSQLRTQKQREQEAFQSYLKSIQAARQDILNASRAGHQKAARLARAVNQYHVGVEREEQRRQERLSKDRIRALKADDEEAYLRLLDTQKDTRLTHLLQQTDRFLDDLTASVRAQQTSMARNLKESRREERLRAAIADARRSGTILGEVELAELAERIDAEVEDVDMAISSPALDEYSADYYGTAHAKREEVHAQADMLRGGKLKDYQIKGLQWMLSLYNNHLNGILADEMGLGKTIQTISLITYLVEKKAQTGPYLVIVPLSTMTNWSLEFARWAPELKVVEYRGVPNQRKGLAKTIRDRDFNVCLTTYEYVIKDKSILSKPQWLYLIIDEGHRMKNAHSKLAITLSVAYRSHYRLILTGTPLQNNLPELWALLNFILPDIFSSAGTFDDWFNAPFEGGERVELNEEETLLIIRRLHKVLRPFLLRRLKKDVESELPDKVELILKCPMSALQRRLYDSIAQKTLSASNNTSILKRFNNVIMQLRKICNHPFVFEEVERHFNSNYEHFHLANETLWRVSGKFELLQRMIPKLKATGHRILIFFQMTQIMSIMEDMLNVLGIRFLRLDGSTKAEDRTELLGQFNAPNSPYTVFLLSTRAGGLGLNLQTADTVIIFDSDWNPHQDLQAQDRAHRIGQTKEVRIFRLITNASVEEYIFERAQFKLSLDGKVIQAGKFDQKSTNEEREELLRAMLEGDSRKEESANGEDDEDDDYKDDDELNELIARGEHELVAFRKIDAEARKESKSRLMEFAELPKALTVEEVVAPDDDSMDSRRSKAGRANYDERMSDDSWLRKLEKTGELPVPKQPSLKIKINNNPVASLASRIPVVTGNLDQAASAEVIAFVIDAMEAATEPGTGRYRIELFQELPSPEDYPDYYQVIREPISLAEIRIAKYASIRVFKMDIERMFANARTYNRIGSWVWEDAVELEATAMRAIETALVCLAENRPLPLNEQDSDDGSGGDMDESEVPPSDDGEEDDESDDQSEDNSDGQSYESSEAEEDD